MNVLLLLGCIALGFMYTIIAPAFVYAWFDDKYFKGRLYDYFNTLPEWRQWLWMLGWPINAVLLFVGLRTPPTDPS